jgi:ATP-dependent protease ClpP protease subunit
MNKFFLEVNSKQADQEPEETTEVEEADNDIYFYTDVTKKSIYQLVKKLDGLSRDYASIRLNYRLNDFKPEVLLHINSNGGSLLDCFAALDRIRNSPYTVHSIVEGSAASAATLMSVVAQKRSMSKYSHMLIHQLSSGMWGKFEEIKDEMHNCNILMDAIYDIYGKYTKIPKNVLKDLLKRDIYLDSKTCLKYGLVDKINE